MFLNHGWSKISPKTKFRRGPVGNSSTPKRPQSFGNRFKVRVGFRVHHWPVAVPIGCPGMGVAARGQVLDPNHVQIWTPGVNFEPFRPSLGSKSRSNLDFRSKIGDRVDPLLDPNHVQIWISGVQGGHKLGANFGFYFLGVNGPHFRNCGSGSQKWAQNWPNK